MKRSLLFILSFVLLNTLLCSDLILAQNSRSVKVAGIILKWIPKECELNYSRAEKLIREAASEGAQIICTTESFLDGYAMRDDHISINQLKDLAESIPNGKYLSLLKKLADENDIYLIAGLIERHNDQLFNSSVLIDPSGDVAGVYRKHYLFGKEKSIYSPGTEFPAFATPYGKIGMM